MMRILASLRPRLGRWAALAGRAALAILLVLNALFLAVVAALLPFHRPAWYDGQELLLDCALEASGRVALEDFASERDESWTLACLIGPGDRAALLEGDVPIRWLPPEDDHFLWLAMRSSIGSEAGLRVVAARRAPGEPICKPVGPGASLRVASRLGGGRFLVLEAGR
jgi:hypothetical protein